MRATARTVSKRRMLLRTGRPARTSRSGSATGSTSRSSLIRPSGMAGSARQLKSKQAGGANVAAESPQRAEAARLRGRPSGSGGVCVNGPLERLLRQPERRIGAPAVAVCILGVDAELHLDALLRGLRQQAQATLVELQAELVGLLLAHRELRAGDGLAADPQLGEAVAALGGHAAQGERRGAARNAGGLAGDLHLEGTAQHDLAATDGVTPVDERQVEAR